MHCCLECWRSVDKLITVKPAQGQKRPPRRMCEDCFKRYQIIMESRKSTAHK